MGRVGGRGGADNSRAGCDYGASSVEVDRRRARRTSTTEHVRYTKADIRTGGVGTSVGCSERRRLG
jgi:hypothetical protein